jgi:Arc/MetJ-type ribon-helix-helix transcriptional regulator
MKKKVSISIEERTIIELEDYVSEGSFRSKSHVVEFAINKFIKEKKNA